jgi:hypothetical protein
MGTACSAQNQMPDEILKDPKPAVRKAGIASIFTIPGRFVLGAFCIMLIIERVVVGIVSFNTLRRFVEGDFGNQ